MINCGNFNFDNGAVLGEPVVMVQGTGAQGLVTLTTSVTGPVFKVYTVATLPAATTALKGSVVAVSDADSPALGTTLVGSGDAYCLALCTGAEWVAA